ncbi:sugar ABC transporter permease [Arthrobacter sp. JUb115]|uniref:carbohydrate ABC transporter permease n=1 Tax=Arthrobacter sp. JUb115 TaxID=2485108 RepID=UPI0010E7EA4D|nr:sugar ABC transporter permease [Arthrobacter sp. JUb115]TDU20268.1 carbohydrate ABC transporter membrane protein 1 (CUT1 family) [Arthrobacter sp. JUb115]
MTITDGRTVPPGTDKEQQKPEASRRPSGVGFGRWWWALPAVALTLVVTYMSTAFGAFFAFTDWTGLGDFNFVGLDNFIQVFQDPALLGSVRNTLFLAGGFIVFTNILGLLFALALNRTLKTRYLLRALIFMPVVLSSVAVSFIWKFIFAFDGPLNQLLGAVGLGQFKQDWLANPTLALWCILAVMVWQSIGFVMVIYLAGLATVPVELEEAAALDGAGMWQRFRSITLPTIQPSLAIATVLTLIQGLSVFDQVLTLTGGGPGDATQTLATQIYTQTFLYGAFGLGAAAALVLTVFILILAIIQQFIVRDRANIGD